MEMEEIIVIDEDSDDLEEGEITDDIEMIFQIERKSKRLPRRYALQNKSPIDRHKNYKHKEKNKFLNPTKLESIHRRKHKSSCPHRNSEKHRLKHRQSHHNHNSFNTKSAFKNYTSPPRAPSLSKKVHSNLQNSENEINFPKLLSDYKKAKERLNQKVEKVQNNNSVKNESVSCTNDSKKTNSCPPKQELADALPLEDLTEIKKGEESDEEDVEELRRKALATCAKKQLISKADEESSNEMPKLSLNSLPSLSNKVSLDHLIETFNGECDNDSRDNYEVVDMDLDEEEGSCQKVNDDNLFIIDKTPANTEFSPNVINGHLNQKIESHSPVENENHLQSNHSQTIDDFEEQLLRAEVIASMNSSRQKRQSPPKLPIPVEEKVSEIIAKVDMLHNAVSTLHKEMRPKPCAIYSKGPLQNSVKQPPKRIIDAKSKFSNFKNNKTTASPPPPRGVNTIQERLIITLNNDTSTDESDEETNENASQNIPVSSIEALISSARQKSDAAQLSNVSSVNVSCLSKAQQEEYNSLKKLLAEKTQYSVPAPLIKEKNTPNQSHINLLVKKISVAKANLEKEVGIRSQMEKDLLEKKRNYMASKLRVQLLKEKLHAAEKIRAANLENWKQCTAKLDIVRKSVSKRESLLKLLETELSTKNACFEPNSTTPPV
ncbi:uncharacterized protein LOC129975743 [Argiope bruennichi]|uniref:Uncharacterized protein n=1 Tax=Argiope bruennichi TaxID=94029 RepID=A0A8T0EQF7_ARGBR|nr:uncharacterized protein LOC129975743 [Argiope bruennichi]KAF8778133.1 hypothetical protein HNY73_014887 [Argiope bruennichi]